MSRYLYNVGGAFETVAREHASRPALRLADRTVVTYDELNRYANRLAAVLSARGIGRRDVVAIVHTKTVACYAAMLAALKMGAAYVNLDDQNPAPRIAHIFSTAQPRIVLGESLPAHIATTANACDAVILDFANASVTGEIAAATVDPPPDMGDITGADPAYVMYTSGSTGVPKGAVMTHANLLNFGKWCGTRFGITPTDVFTNLNPMYFDNSVFDFFGSLLNGASLAPVSRETLMDGPKTLEKLEDAGCSVWFSVPSLLIYLMTLKALTRERLSTVKQFIFGGEGYPKPELRKLYDAFGTRARLVNVYGPTECTCICSAWDISERDFDDPTGLVTLGPVAENFSAVVLADGHAAQPGETGELCLLGPQLGLGYMNDPERTAAAFASSPLHGRWNERMYRTGDLVRLDPDGKKLHFVGRADNQIKHMGYRIELEEIEAALSRVSGVVQAAVVQKQGRGAVKILVAFVAAIHELDERDLRRGLEQLLPHYMIPQRFDVRTHLPKNANGKIDRIALANE